MRLSLRHLLLVVAGLAAGACQNNTVSNGTGTLPPPQKLSYALDPSGDPTQPAGIRLAWDDVQSSDLASYRVYSRGSTSGSFLLRGETRSEEHTSELQSQSNLVCRLLLEKKKL